ncbi:MAG TPA: membrane protein insertion efficiency factor YidD [Chthonomonadales bacterium]|nr:membrane protein insertion efficiency factor YidD [Chthonomonadales bacterium]
MRNAFVFLIRLYQRTSRLRPRICRFQPTCSEYAAQAILKYGPLKGMALGAWRILRCNPWSRGGDDPVS